MVFRTLLKAVMSVAGIGAWNAYQHSDIAAKEADLVSTTPRPVPSPAPLSLASWV